MKAYICPQYGGPEMLRLVELDKPIPGDDEISIRIMATSVTSADRRVRALDVPLGLGWIARLVLGMKGPRQPVLGTELAGVIEAVGANVRKFRVGEEVIAFPGGKMGCHAEYRCMHQDGAVAAMPENLSFADAAGLCFGGCTALDFLRRANVTAREDVMIIGASGGVGTAMTQLAKHIGANVTAVASTDNLALVASLGADRVIDYTIRDITRDREQYDVIFDVVGATSFGPCKHLLKANGRFVALAGDLSEMIAPPWVSLSSDKKLIAGPAEERPEYVAEISRLASAGILKPVIDRVYSFSQMAIAHEYVDTGRKRGNVVIALG